MSKIAFDTGAPIDKFRGDGMRVFFGAPYPVEPKEGALKCISMAIKMCREVEALSEKWFNGFLNLLKHRFAEDLFQ